MIYDDVFYNMVHDEAQVAASLFVPAIIEYCNPKSVLDIGCARGTWLAEMKKRGVLVTIGIDYPTVKSQSTLIPDSDFIGADLSQEFPEDRRLDQSFDLILCLELAEHLPEDRAISLVRWIGGKANCVVWSAAIPDQGGVNHINEQWQSYWASLFNRICKLTPNFLLREMFWNNAIIPPYYRQNVLIYDKKKNKKQTSNILDVVHPDLWTYKIKDFRTHIEK